MTAQSTDDEFAGGYVTAMTEAEIQAFRKVFASGLESVYWGERPRDLSKELLPTVEQWRKDELIEWSNKNRRLYQLTNKGRAVGRIIFEAELKAIRQQAEQGE